jgi:hypothetical protein
VIGRHGRRRLEVDGRIQACKLPQKNLQVHLGSDTNMGTREESAPFPGERISFTKVINK